MVHIFEHYVKKSYSTDFHIHTLKKFGSSVQPISFIAIDGKTWLVVGQYQYRETQLDLLDPLNVNQGWLKGIDYF